jgi:hypothetical protein
MLIKHRLSHFTQGFIFPFHKTILGRRIQTRKLVFKTQVMAKGFKSSRQDLEQNQTSPHSPQERTPMHTESSRPPQQGNTTSHPQIAHELGQQGPYGGALMDAQSSHR